MLGARPSCFAYSSAMCSIRSIRSWVFCIRSPVALGFGAGLSHENWHLLCWLHSSITFRLEADSMRPGDAFSLREKWGDKDCDHPALAQEVMFGQRTGDYICTRCGETRAGREWGRRPAPERPNPAADGA